MPAERCLDVTGRAFGASTVQRKTGSGVAVQVAAYAVTRASGERRDRRAEILWGECFEKETCC